MAEEKETTASDSPEPFQETADAFSERLSDFSDSLRDWIESQPWVPGNFADLISSGILFASILVAAWIIYVILRPLILKFVQRIVKGTSVAWDDHLFGFGVFKWLTHVFPALLLLAITPGLFSDSPVLAKVLHVLASLYLILAAYLMLDSLLNAIHSFYKDKAREHRINLGPFIQVGKLLFALVGIILAVAVIAGESPLVLLGGIGVFASVLMLVFKDAILGFVAGVQLSSNQMLAVGEWLEMPKHGADGEVEEIGLTTVKVRNWDKTITTIPSYALISESFKNWRGMTESGGRRIKRKLVVDTNSIKLCDDQMLDRFRQIEHISKYLKKKEKEVSEWNAEHRPDGEEHRVNGRRLTNVGTFRAYIESYLRSHPDISDEMTLLVRQLEPEGRGLPIQIYCFSTNTAWAAYEGIQADIFDHLLAVAAEFDLRIFQEPTGRDLQKAVCGLGEELDS